MLCCAHCRLCCLRAAYSTLAASPFIASLPAPSRSPPASNLPRCQPQRRWQLHALAAGASSLQLGRVVGVNCRQAAGWHDHPGQTQSSIPAGPPGHKQGNAPEGRRCWGLPRLRGCLPVARGALLRLFLLRLPLLSLLRLPPCPQCLPPRLPCPPCPFHLCLLRMPPRNVLQLCLRLLPRLVLQMGADGGRGAWAGQLPPPAVHCGWRGRRLRRGVSPGRPAKAAACGGGCRGGCRTGRALPRPGPGQHGSLPIVPPGRPGRCVRRALPCISSSIAARCTRQLPWRLRLQATAVPAAHL